MLRQHDIFFNEHFILIIFATHLPGGGITLIIKLPLFYSRVVVSPGVQAGAGAGVGLWQGGKGGDKGFVQSWGLRENACMAGTLIRYATHTASRRLLAREKNGKDQTAD